MDANAEEATDSDHEGLHRAYGMSAPRGRLFQNTPKHISRLSENGWHTWINAIARQAVHSVAPHVGLGPAPPVHLHWAKLPKWSCALQLINRNLDLQREALHRGSGQAGILTFAKEIAAQVAAQSRMARNQQTKQLRRLFLDPGSKFQLAHNCLQTMPGLPDEHMEAPSLTHHAAHLQTIEALVALFESKELHADQKLYPIFVQALASGALCRQRKRTDDVPLADFVSIDYEVCYISISTLRFLPFGGGGSGARKPDIKNPAHRTRVTNDRKAMTSGSKSLRDSYLWWQALEGVWGGRQLG